MTNLHLGGIGKKVVKMSVPTLTIQYKTGLFNIILFITDSIRRRESFFEVKLAQEVPNLFYAAKSILAMQFSGQ